MDKIRETPLIGCISSGELTDEEYFEINNNAAQYASKEAQQQLLNAGIGYVYGRSGKIYRRMLDGSEIELEPIMYKSKE